MFIKKKALLKIQAQIRRLESDLRFMLNHQPKFKKEDKVLYYRDGIKFDDKTGKKVVPHYHKIHSVIIMDRHFQYDISDGWQTYYVREDKLEMQKLKSKKKRR